MGVIVTEALNILPGRPSNKNSLLRIQHVRVNWTDCAFFAVEVKKIVGHRKRSQMIVDHVESVFGHKI